MKRYFRILACALSLCIILCAVSSCMTLARFGDFVQRWENGDFPEYDNAWMEYTLSEQDWKDFESALWQCQNRIEEDASYTLIDQSVMDMEEIYYHIMTQGQVAYILYSMDMEKQSAKDNYLESSKMQTDAYDAYMSFCQELYESDYDYKDHFFASWSEEELALMSSYSDRVVELNDANDQIVVQYRDLDRDSTNSFSKQTGKLFLQLVRNNNAIAKEYGYDSYPEYAYETVYFRDYGPEEVETLRKYIKKYLVPLCTKTYDRFLENYGKLSAREQEEISNLLYEEHDDTDWLRLYFQSLPTYMQRLMSDTIDSNRALYVDHDGALEGAFTGYLYEYEYPVCYFGPGYQSAFTVAHEAGHYFASYAQKGMSQSIDLAEVYSQANEFLFLSYLEDSEMDEDVYRVLADYQLYQALSVIIVATIVDDFEQTVYTESERFEAYSDSKVSAALDSCMREICKEYGGTKFVAEYLTNDIDLYWKYVVIENPMYYISYAMSGIASLDLYCKAMEDYDATLEIYMNLAKYALPEDQFLLNLDSVGLASPFEKEIYEALTETFGS